MNGIGLTVENYMINCFILSQSGTEWRRRFFDFEEKIISTVPREETAQKKGDMQTHTSEK